MKAGIGAQGVMPWQNGNPALGHAIRFRLRFPLKYGFHQTPTILRLYSAINVNLNAALYHSGEISLDDSCLQV